MRTAAEIKDELREGRELLPEAEYEARRDILFLEVLLDIRGLLDSIDSWAAHTEGHADKLRKEFT